MPLNKETKQKKNKVLSEYIPDKIIIQFQHGHKINSFSNLKCFKCIAFINIAKQCRFC